MISLYVFLCSVALFVASLGLAAFVGSEYVKDKEAVRHDEH